jgi:hypothetical protein
MVATASVLCLSHCKILYPTWSSDTFTVFLADASNDLKKAIVYLCQEQYLYNVYAARLRMNLFVESLCVGIILLIISIPVMGVARSISPQSKSKVKYYVSSVIIGMLTHLVCEFMGINRWYCSNGSACSIKNISNTHPASW